MSVDYRLRPATTTIAEASDLKRIITAPVTARAGTHQTNVRFLNVALAALAISACTATSMAVARPTVSPDLSVVPTNCAARDTTQDVEFRISVEADSGELARWCRAVGGPVYVDVAAGGELPSFDDLVIVSWNAHL